VRSGDEDAFMALVESMHGSLIRVALSFVRSRAVAEEVTQETWLAVINGLDRFEGRSSLKTWIFQILKNRARTRAKRERRTIPTSSFGGDDAEHEASVDAARFDERGMWGVAPRPWESDTPERLSMNQQAIEFLRKALDDLPPAQRAVVTMRDVEGLSSGEVCDILEISSSNQRVLLHRGRSTLRAALETYVELQS
jgi:RNA polymerase sigma-70 factor (ECF subfamily)